MPTFTGTDGKNAWTIVNPGTFTIDGKGGVDTIDFGTSLRSSYDIYRTSDGAVHVDSISGASGDGALLVATLFNIEVLQFDSKRESVDLLALFGDVTQPTVAISDDTPGTAIGPVTYTFSFSEAVTGLAFAAFTVTQGSVISVSGSGALWNAVVVPSQGAQGSIGLTLKSAAVVDAAGNSSAEASAAPQSFDTLAPTLLSGSPAAGESGVALARDIVLTFSETLARGSGSITLRDAAGTVAEVFDSALSTRLTLSGNILTIDPSQDLAPGTTYSVVFAAGSLRDAAGNALDSTGLAPYSFTSAAPSTRLIGTAGNDAFAPAPGILNIDGLGGIDTVTLNGSPTLYRTSASAGVYKVMALDGSRNVDLSQVERLAYSTSRVAIDLDGNAGSVAKVLGAVFGAASVRNTEYVGIGLSLLDGGMSYAGLMQLALDVRLGAGASHVAVVDLLYTNVVGVAPPKTEQDRFVAVLDNHTYTPATLGVLAADTDLNIAAIDLVGLAHSGLTYLPA